MFKLGSKIIKRIYHTFDPITAEKVAGTLKSFRAIYKFISRKIAKSWQNSIFLRYRLLLFGVELEI